MSGILDDVMGAVGAVAQTAAGATPSNTGGTAVAQVTQDRLATLENFVIVWGPVLEKLAPLLQKLESL